MTHAPPPSSRSENIRPVPATGLSQDSPSHGDSSVSHPNRYVPQRRTAVDTDAVSKSLSSRIDELSDVTD